MATLGDMRTRISNELQIDATTYADEIDNAIFSAIEFYNDKDFWFLDASPTTLVLSATSDYSLATFLPGRSQIKAVVLQVGQVKPALHYRGLSELIELGYSEGFEGTPTYWGIDHGALLIVPNAQTTRTAEVFYSLRYSMTASASASSVWTNEAEELIRLHAEADILENRIKDFAEASRKHARVQMILANIDEKNVMQRGTRRIKPFM